MKYNDKNDWVTVGEDNSKQNTSNQKDNANDLNIGNVEARKQLTKDKEKSIAESNFGESATFVDEEGNKFAPYAVSQTYRFPLWLKACFAKWWFPGMIFYFVFFGLETFRNGTSLLALVLGLAWGLVTEFIVNHYFKEFSSPGHDYTKYIMFKFKKFYISLPLNLIWGLMLSYASAYTVSAFVLWVSPLMNISSDDAMLYFGPILYATCMMAYEVAVLMIKYGITLIIKKAKGKTLANVGAENSEVVNDNSDQTINSDMSSLKLDNEVSLNSEENIPCKNEEKKNSN